MREQLPKMPDDNVSVALKQKQKTGLFLTWILCCLAIPLLSINGRPLQILVCSILSPFLLSVLFPAVVIIIFLVLVCLQKTLNASIKLLQKKLLIGAGFIVISMLLPPVERVHVLLFGLFGFLSQRLFGTKVALIICLTVSGLDELLQYFLPDRVGDLRDVLTNAVSSILGIKLSCLFMDDSPDTSRSHGL